jgi:hypothetical protein
MIPNTPRIGAREAGEGSDRINLLLVWKIGLVYVNATWSIIYLSLINSRSRLGTVERNSVLRDAERSCK